MHISELIDLHFKDQSPQLNTTRVSPVWCVETVAFVGPGLWMNIVPQIISEVLYACMWWLAFWKMFGLSSVDLVCAEFFF